VANTLTGTDLEDEIKTGVDKKIFSETLALKQQKYADLISQQQVIDSQIKYAPLIQFKETMRKAYTDIHG
jgi:hypothetical protein